MKYSAETTAILRQQWSISDRQYMFRRLYGHVLCDMKTRFIIGISVPELKRVKVKKNG